MSLQYCGEDEYPSLLNKFDIRRVSAAMDTKGSEAKMQSRPMNIQMVTLRVDKWSQMLDYYRNQLKLTLKFSDQQNQYAMFDTGPVRLAIEGTAKPAFAKRPDRPGVMLNFEVTDLAQAIESLRAGDVALLTEVRHGPGYDYVAVDDPEGNEHIVFQRSARS